jgi:LPS sulfotransferase NodH
MYKTPFVVLGTQRSGTTLLITLLDSHPEIFCAGEIFNTNPTKIHHDEFSYRNNKNKKIYEFLDYFYKKNNKFKAVGFKLMLDQLKLHPDILNFIKNNNLKIISMERENTLKTYISHLIAKKTNIWASGSPVKQVRISIDTASIIAELDAIVQKKEENEKISSKFDCLKVTYENLTTNKEKTVRVILNFINVNDRFIELKTSQTKINSDELKDVIENYEEVYTVLKNTSYEKYLF